MNDFAYVDCSIPEGMTIREWRNAGRPASSGWLEELCADRKADLQLEASRGELDCEGVE